MFRAYTYALLLLYFIIVRDAHCIPPAAACQTQYRDIEIESKVANAFIWSNFTSSPGSLKVETSSMLLSAEKEIVKAKAPKNFCSNDCTLNKNPLIVFYSRPQQFLINYSDYNTCQRYLESTQKEPLRFESQSFPDIESYIDWFSNFSQGGGTQGISLYKQCDLSCSPQFKSIINKTLSGYTIENSVICGHARDKNNGLYNVSLFYRWACKDRNLAQPPIQ